MPNCTVTLIMYLFTTVRYKKTLKLGYFSRIVEICSTALTAKIGPKLAKMQDSYESLQYLGYMTQATLSSAALKSGSGSLLPLGPSLKSPRGFLNS